MAASGVVPPRSCSGAAGFQPPRDIQAKLLGAELLVKLRNLELPAVNFAEAKALARAATQAINAGRVGYATLTARAGEATTPDQRAQRPHGAPDPRASRPVS